MARHLLGSGLIILMNLTGCARVDPRADWDRAGRLVQERTGVAQVYSPAVEEGAADETIERLLTNDLTVDTAIQVALLNNPAFQAEFAALGASRADVVQSSLFTNPTFSISAGFVSGGGRPRFNVGLAQQIADLWQIPVRRRIAEDELERVLLATARRGIDLVAEVRTRCYRLLAFQADAAMLGEMRGLAQRGVALAEAQLRGGEVGRLDVNLTRAALVDVELELRTLERERRSAEIELGHTLGLSRWNSAWQLTDTLPAAVPNLSDDAELIAAALAERLDARSAVIQVRTAEQETLRQMLRIFPDVSVGAELERLENRPPPGRKILADTVRESLAAGRLTAPAIQSRGQRQLEKAGIIDALLGPTATITLPLWDQNQAQIAKARYTVTQRRKELEELLDTIASDVQQAAATLRNAAALVQDFERAALPEAKDNLELAQTLYRNGEQGVLVVLNAQESLLRRQRGYVDARRDYAVALATLEQALGRRLAESGPGPTSAPVTPPASAPAESGE